MKGRGKPTEELRRVAATVSRDLADLAGEIDRIVDNSPRLSAGSRNHLAEVTVRIRRLGQFLGAEADTSSSDESTLGALLGLSRAFALQVTLALGATGLAADLVTLAPVVDGISRQVVDAGWGDDAQSEQATQDLLGMAELGMADADARSVAENPPVRVELRPDQVTEFMIDDLKRVLAAYPGNSSVYLHLSDSQVIKLADAFNVDASGGVVPELRVLLGADAVGVHK